MNLKKTFLASTVAMACSFGATANAQNFADCVSTPISTFDGNIVEAAVATPALSTLVDAVLAAGLDGTLATAENITVFAPTNDAFAAIPADITGAILSDVDVLTEVLTYHVVAGAQDPRKYLPVVKREALNGGFLYFTRNNGAARVNNAAVDCAGIKTDNGWVFVIDSVLQPGF